MLLPALGAVKETAKQANCTNNLKQMGTALAVYSQSYQYWFPNNASAGYTKATRSECFEMLRSTQLDEPKSFVCPSTVVVPSNPGDVIGDNFSYTYFAGLKETDSPSSGIVADGYKDSDTDANWNHAKKGGYLRLDSSAVRPGGNGWWQEVKYQNAATAKADFQYN